MTMMRTDPRRAYAFGVPGSDGYDSAPPASPAPYAPTTATPGAFTGYGPNQFVGNLWGNGSGWGAPPPAPAANPSQDAYRADLANQFGFSGRAADLGWQLGFKDKTPASAVYGAIGEGFRLRDVEDARYASALAGIKDQFAKLQTPTFTEEYGRNLFSDATDQIGRDSVAGQSMLRSQLGGRGILPGSGLAQGLQFRAEMERERRVGGVSRDIAIEKAKTDAADRAQNFLASLKVGEFENQSPSLLGLDTLGNVANLRLSQELGRNQIEAARVGAKGAKDAAVTSGLFGLGASLLGAIF